MTLKIHHNIRKTFSKGMLIAILLTGFFTFSGFVITMQSNRPIVQTTWLIGNKARVTKKIQCQPRLYNHKTSQGVESLSSVILNFTRLHNKLTAVNLKTHSKPSLSKSHSFFFYQAKTIPQNEESDPAFISC